MTHDRTTDPICRIEWRRADALVANGWNPNMVLDAELRLLERSILRTGWVQPVLIRPGAEGEPAIIVDGFHRVQLSLGSEALRARYAGLVPCAVMNVTRSEAMMLTVRINAAKGSHRAVRMADLVRELIDVEKVEPEVIARDCGMLVEEVRRLYEDDVFKARDIANYRYSQAWEPAAETADETKRRKEEGLYPEGAIVGPVAQASDKQKAAAAAAASTFKPRGRPPAKKAKRKK